MGVALWTGPRHVDVWSAEPQKVVQAIDATAALERLSPEERQRLDAAAGPRARGERLTTYLLARWALAKQLGRRADQLALSRDADGRPRLTSPAHAGVNFSLAHARGLVICGVTTAEAGIGVDVEQRRPRPDALVIARRFFCADEARALEVAPATARADRFWALWTLKEALVKAAGLDLFDGLGTCAFRLRGRQVSHAFRSRRDRPQGSWRFALVAPSAAHFIAIAVRTDRAQRIDVRVHDVTQEVANG